LFWGEAACFLAFFIFLAVLSAWVGAPAGVSELATAKAGLSRAAAISRTASLVI
jgi:hypothetical protein